MKKALDQYFVKHFKSANAALYFKVYSFLEWSDLVLLLYIQLVRICQMNEIARRNIAWNTNSLGFHQNY